MDKVNACNYFEKNLKALAEYHPDLIQEIKKPIPFDYRIKETSSGLKNFCLKKDGDYQPLYMNHDPLGDLNELFDSIKDVEGCFICFTGAGLLYHSAPLLEKVGRKARVVLCEAFPGIIGKAMELYDLRDVFSNPNLRIVTGDYNLPEKVFVKNNDRFFVENGFFFLGNPRFEKLDSTWYRELEKRFYSYTLSIQADRNTIKKNGRLLLENRFNNLPAMAYNKSISHLKDLFLNKPAIIVAAGPSLSGNISEIKKYKDRLVIIAVDSAVAPLLNNGITPHFVASVDLMSLTFEKLSPFTDELRNSNLLFLSGASNVVVNKSLFKNKYFGFLNKDLSMLFSKILGAEVECVANAQAGLHLAIESACLMGCNPLIFAGVDLAYSGVKDHADGTVLHWSSAHIKDDNKIEWIDGVCGKVKSNVVFISMKEICEQFIRSKPEKMFIDSTEGGALISGTKIFDLKGSLKEHCNEIIDVSEIIGLENKEVCDSDESVLANMIHLKEDILSVKKLLSKYYKHITKIDKYLKNYKQTVLDPKEFPENITRLLIASNEINEKLNNVEIFKYLSVMFAEYGSAFLYHEMRLGAGDKKEPLFIDKYNQQKFVQKTKKEILHFIEKQLNSQIDVFSKIKNLKKKCKKGNIDQKIDLIEFYLENNHLDRANDLLTEMDDENESVIFAKGKLLLNMDRVEKAKKIFDGLVEKKNSYAERVDLLYKAYIKNSLKNNVGVQHIDRILFLDPENRNALELKQKKELRDLEVKTRNNIYEADLLHGKNEIQKAYEMLSDENDLGDSFKGEWFSRQARYLIELGEDQKGIEKLNQAVKFDPSTAVLWDEIGDLFFSSGDYESAVIAFENCFQSIPDRFDVLKKIGDSYFMDNKFDSAALAYESVLKLYPENEEIKKTLEKIKDIIALRNNHTDD